MPTSSASDATDILRVTNLTAGYGRLPIINDVSVTARTGQVTAIIGPNGAGKSTLLKAVMGIVQRTAGSVFLADEDVRNARAHDLAKRGVGYVPQVRDVFDPLSVMENLEMGGYLLPRREIGERVDEVFQFFPALAVRRTQRANTLSGGERKMLAIGRVFMRRPKVLLLDEPTANLAPKVADQLLSEHVTRLAQLGVAVLLVEQRAVQALAVSDRGYVMVSGQVTAAGPAADLSAKGDIAKMFLRG